MPYLYKVLSFWLSHNIYVYHVYPEAVPDGKLDLAVYREEESTPFELATYYVNFESE